MIYLDNNATTRPLPAALAAVADSLATFWHNPSSIHRPGQDARAKIELARASVASLIGTVPRNITFTSGGTEAIDLAIRGTLATTRKTRVLTTAVEHAAIRDLVWYLAKRNEVEVVTAPIDRAGVVRLDTLEGLIDDSIALVSIQWANNETGAIQPVSPIASLCRARRVPFHCDATQWVGKEPVQLDSPEGDLTGPDLLTFAPHKFHGPKGVGVLYARQGTGLVPRIRGTQEKERRGGTENVPGILGAGAAADAARVWLTESPSERARLGVLRDWFEAQVIRRAIDASVPAEVNGPRGGSSARLWNTTNIAFPRLEAEALLLAMSERGLAASAGAACSSGSLDPSPVLLAMGVPPELAHGSIRFSLSRETTQNELEQAAAIVGACVKKLSQSLMR